MYILLHPSLIPDCEGNRYSSTFWTILDRTTSDGIFLNVMSRTIGRTLVSGPFGLPGFCINISTPLPRPSGSWCF